MNIKELKTKLSSTKHWYIRLLQWPFVIIAYSILACIMPIYCVVIAFIWPFYNIESEG